MSHPSEDPDDLVQKKIDLNHIKKMTHQMHVPDSIIIGPNRSTFPRLEDNDRIPIRMDVPDRLRPGGNGSTVMLNDRDFFANNEPSPLSDSFGQPLSIPSTLHPKDIETKSDDEYVSVNAKDHQEPAYKVTESGNVETFSGIDEKQILNKLQLLQNRMRQMEQALARRQSRDRLFYTCVIGYFFIQAILSLRRSMLN